MRPQYWYWEMSLMLERGSPVQENRCWRRLKIFFRREHQKTSDRHVKRQIRPGTLEPRYRTSIISWPLLPGCYILLANSSAAPHEDEVTNHWITSSSVSRRRLWQDSDLPAEPIDGVGIRCSRRSTCRNQSILLELS